VNDHGRGGESDINSTSTPVSAICNSQTFCIGYICTRYNPDVRGQRVRGGGGCLQTVKIGQGYEGGGVK